MSFLRRVAVISVAAAALAAGSGFSVASAAEFGPGPDGHYDRPIHFGPLEIPRDGTVSGGFSWETSNGGGFDPRGLGF